MEESDEGDGMLGLEDGVICVSLAPQFHAMMLARQSKKSCCPKLFERASNSWWDPKFDSEILERQYIESSLPKLTLRFRYSLLFVLLNSFVWGIYWLSTSSQWQNPYFAVCMVLFLISLLLLIATYAKPYQSRQLLFLTAASVLFMVVSLLPFVPFALKFVPGQKLMPVDVSLPTIFIFYVEILLLVYTIIPLPLYVAILLCSLYSLAFEMLSSIVLQDSAAISCILRIILHVSIHLIGSHIMIMNEVRMRGTFMSVGQSLLVRRQIESEKALKEKMILSVMPPEVANWLMETTYSDEIVHYGSQDGAPILRKESERSTIQGEGFRPFNMNVMDHVSILFADIVGFTRMSSNKTAEHLVGLLNDLFGRFDELCVQNGCEKINTLGDCYYAVSGCPMARADHAECCVNMGLGMIKAIKQFDEDKNEDVNMRVGVHTGKVLCGIVGTMRFKFDVWSKDVTLANQMESTGTPGLVHITESTKKFIDETKYILEDGPDICDRIKEHRTYFISGKVHEEIEDDNKEDSSKSPTKSIEHFESERKLSSSLPNMIEVVTEGGQKDNISSGWRIFAPGNYVGQLKIRLPRLSLSTEYTKPKTGSLSKVFNRTKDEKGSACEKTSLTSLSGPCNVEPPPLSHLKIEATHCDPNTKDPRKDSGIQEQIFSMGEINSGDTVNNRASDYFTSSHSSINENKETVKEAPPTRTKPFKSTFHECEKRFLQLRKQSDIQMMKCVQRERIHRSGIACEISPLSPLTLFFVDGELERTYRQTAHNPRSDESKTLASTLYDTYFDVLVTFFVFLSVNCSLFILVGFPPIYGSYFVICLLWHLFILLLCTVKVWLFSLGTSDEKGCLTNVYRLLTQWTALHICGASLLCLPIISVFINFSCSAMRERENSLRYFCYIAAVAIIHFCNFTQLNCWVKNTFATIVAVAFMVMLKPQRYFCTLSVNITAPFEGNETLFDASNQHINWFHSELIISYSMLLILVWLLNREFEISYRLSFYGYVMATRDKVRVQSMKNQTELLLHNIIPQHVANILKTTATYSRNHKNVGVMFASIVNFNELYSEDYSSGKEFMRFLNELVADFDELLTRDKYKNIEKIKTIGSTYMAASGLNPTIRSTNAHQNQHICDLVDFANQMYQVVDNFNQSMIGFRFVLRIGLNCGDVTAGVVGTKKLFYDIWGDAVNIASRMDSTGIPGRIQVTEECSKILNAMYSMEFRGSVFVKGKDNMNVFLLKETGRTDL